MTQHGSNPLIGAAQLQQAKRILYMSHLALGDYVYQGVFLQQLAATYPHLEIDVWFDDCREQRKSWHGGRNQILGQWLESEPNISHIYANPDSEQQRQQQIQDAQQRHYDLVFFIATTRSERFCHYARLIAGDGCAVGAYALNAVQRWQHKEAIAALDASIKVSKSTRFDHISEFYRHHFHALVAMDSPARAFQQLRVPQLYLDALQNSDELDNFVFINHLSTTEKRDWQLAQVFECIATLHQAQPTLRFVINATNEQVTQLQHQVQSNNQLRDINISTFSAKRHFYELPAMISRARLVISVETAIMHLAAALNVPALALIRAKAHQWRPLGPGEILVGGKRVDSISAQTVADKALALLAKA
ncbi:glycosyltransferase family 9 protein [Pseudoalteromonas sp. T1lg75]|uniref:glycosyltransferase family 9 protein n=1 Tax=Pseudoalteromonas sp. T1lg75 TaxID=2077102 RepID=UPI000CF6DAEE|nr:glycosyltransferase family 9 protein [Pseudoalteromonas sp. T1lg75]